MWAKLVKTAAIVLILTGCDFFNSKLSKLTIETENGPIVYRVETAATRSEMAKGLMDRKELSADSGMIFVLNGEMQVAMWMKDTLIPLDMIFTNKEGKIIWIYENALPHSTFLIQPRINEPLYAVIELNGGDIKKKGIKVGDMVKHKTLPRE